MGESELDIHLRRSAGESWGFRLIGGVDFNMPLTVVKVVPHSPADQAGLHNGDAVTFIDGQDATGMTHEDSRRILAGAQDTHSLGVVRGLYDMVIDEYEPIYEQIDQGDFDQPSAPTEVPPDYLDISVNLPDFTGAAVDPNQTGLLKPDVVGNADERSLTDSPFVLPTKPYRPFSTEPVAEVPPIEDPIILNPGYHDEFGQLDKFGKLKDEDFLPPTRFKLPISEQYDPDGTKQKIKETKHVTVKEFSTAVKEEMIKESKKVSMKKEFEMKDQVMTKDEVEFLEEMKKEIDLEKIEMTATSIVDDSIQKAMSVAEEIKKEIDSELTESSVTVKESIAAYEAKTESMTISEVSKKDSKKYESQKMATELVEVTEKTADEIIKTNNHMAEVSLSQKDDVIQEQVVIEEQKSGKDQNLSEEERSLTEQVKGVSMKKVHTKRSVQEAQSYVEKDIKHETSKQGTKLADHTDLKNSTTTKTSQTAKENTKTEMNYTTSAHRAFTLGLQTIPNIRGTAILSSHFDLLLRTFFVHLTDVMVALSTFILAEPAILKGQQNTETIEKQDMKKEHVTKREAKVVNSEHKEDKYTDVVDTEAKKLKSLVEEENITQAVTKFIQENQNEELVQKQAYEKEESVALRENKYTANEMNLYEENAFLEQLEEKRKLSGSQMAQLVEKRPEGFMKHLEAVITEFESKSAGEDIETVRERRSKSRSAVNTPVEFLDKASQEISELSNTVVSSTSKKTRKAEAQFESLEHDTKSEGKKTYIAIVESHVYTNKDAILEEQLGFSEAVSASSAEPIKGILKAETKAEGSSKAVINETELIKKEEKFAKVESAKEIIKEAIESKQQIITEKETEIVEKSLERSSVNEVKQAVVQVKKPALRRHQLILRKAKDMKEEETTAKVEVINEKKDEIVVKEEKSAAMVDSMAINADTKAAKTAILEKTIFDANVAIKQEQDIKNGCIELIKTESASLDKVSSVMMKEETKSLTEKSIAVTAESTVQKVSVQEFEAHVEDKKEEKTEEEIVFKYDFSKKEKDESAALKISKEQIIEQEKTSIQLEEQTDIAMKKVEINNFESKSEHFESMKIDQEAEFVAQIEQGSSFVAKLDKEISFVAKSLDTREIKDLKLSLDTEKARKKAETQISEENTTPVTVPTPLTDEYVFTLTTTLPKREGPPIPRDCTPSDDDEDPHIVKKGLVPHIDAELGSPKIFDPPLSSPPMTPKSPTSPRSPTRPKYCKPGLMGGADRDYSKEEILEIERKSSLLASAIDQTIKSIEEYKEEVGMKQEYQNDRQNGVTLFQNGESVNDTNQNGVIYNGYTTVVETKVFDTITQAATTDITSNGEAEPESTKVVNESIKVVDESTKVVGESTKVIESFTDQTAIIGTSEAPETVINVSAFVNEEAGRKVDVEKEKRDPLEGYRPVNFDLEELNALRAQRAALGIKIPVLSASQERELYKTPTGQLIGTHQGIVDGLEKAVVDTEEAKEMGKPGISEDKIAELISGESEMLREAHVMGLSRVLKSHMHKDTDDSSVDFNRIKPIIESLKDSEVLKALNEEVLIAAEERKKKEDKSWTTFLQKPKRPVPRSKFGPNKDLEEEKAEPYKVKIVKQPKPKVAPDYKPENFNTGLLPWEERALREPTPPPVAPEDPILIPEDPPEVLEAVDPLPESEVPDLEDSGIPLPPPAPPKDPTPPPEEASEAQEEELDLEAVVEETEQILEENLAEEMDVNLAEQLMTGVQNMVDPNAPLDQQLAQMRAQLAALSQLPGVIQQSLEMVTKQLSHLSQLEATQSAPAIEEAPEAEPDTTPAAVEDAEGEPQNEQMTIEDVTQQMAEAQQEEKKEPTLTPEEIQKMRQEEEAMLEEQKRMEKQKKELMEAARLEHESRQVKQRPTPRVGKPKPVFGPVTPQERPLVLPGGRKWRKPVDAYNETLFAETLAAQAEIIAGKAKGINFMKYEKPPVSLDHLKESDTYKLVHDLEMTPAKRVEMLTPVIAEADYREKCRSMTPCPERLAQMP